MPDKFQIRFERTGGFAGIPTDIVVDSQKLDKEEKDKLSALIESSDIRKIKSAGQDSSSKTKPDRFTYRIALETENESIDVTIPEENITTSLKPLITFLFEMSRRRKN